MARYDIFISYRRSGGYETAKHLYDLLTRDGYKVSFDIDTLRNGNFDTAIYDRIRKCKDFIIILSPGIFDRSLQKGSSAENDWVRKELAFALKENKNIIPVMLSGFGAFPSGLPADIAEVARKNAPPYTREYFNEFYRRLKHDFIQSRSRKKAKIITAVTAAVAIACIAILAATGTWTPWRGSTEELAAETIQPEENTIQESPEKGTIKEETPDNEANTNTGKGRISEGLTDQKNIVKEVTRNNTTKDEAIKKSSAEHSPVENTTAEHKPEKSGNPENNQAESKVPKPDLTATSTLPDWIFTDTGGFISVAPAGLSESDAEDFAIACSAYQWAISEGFDIQIRDTMAKAVNEASESAMQFTTVKKMPDIPFEYNICQIEGLQNGEKVYSISFASIPEAKNKIRMHSLKKTAGAGHTGVVSTSSIEMSLNSRTVTCEALSRKDGNIDIFSFYLNGKQLRMPPTGKYISAGKFIQADTGRLNPSLGITFTSNLTDDKSLSKSWTKALFSKLLFTPYNYGEIDTDIDYKQIDNRLLSITTSVSDKAFIDPHRLTFNGIQDNTISCTLFQNASKKNEVLKKKKFKEEFGLTTE